MSDAKEAVKRLGEISYLINRQSKEIAALRKDAERYRWMRNQEEYNLPIDPNDMDAAIDAAMKKKS